MRMTKWFLKRRSVPRGNLVPPPELPRDIPGLDVFHPFEVGLLPVLRDELGAPLAHGLNRGLRQRLRVHVPLVREEWLEHGIGAVALRNGVNGGLDLLDEA